MKNLALIVALIAVLAGPVLLRPHNGAAGKTDATLVIITPHNEAIRYEFAQAFTAYYFKKTGKRVTVDWRTPGGTSEISRFLQAQFTSAFENHWSRTLHHEWNTAAQAAFDNPKAPSDDSPAGLARRAFLESNAGIGIDLFFGGGAFDFQQQAAAGRLVDCGAIKAHPELFNKDAIPQTLGGEPFWDREGRWIGTALSAFGICSNTDALARLGIAHPPDDWRNLIDTKYFGQLALADPTQSGAATKAFEMLIQQSISQANSHGWGEPQIRIADGWTQGMQLIQRISANARYFTDSSSKVPSDVELGDAAAGMTIDFYGRFQSEVVRRPDGSSRLVYVTPRGGSSIGADPIGLLRGAPHAELAREFIGFVLSLDGQKLWNWKVGTPGGTQKYALRRLPVRRELYAPEFRAFRSDPDEQPYEQAGNFVYHEEWTASLFRVISFVVRAMCIDPHDELRSAWRALIEANFPPQATVAFSDVSAVGYEAATGRIRETLRSGKKIDQVKLAKELSDSFREQYRHAEALARAGK